MTQYTVITKGYETGLTATALESQIRESFAQDVEVIIKEEE